MKPFILCSIFAKFLSELIFKSWVFSYIISEPVMAGCVCLVLVFRFVFKISRKMVEVPEDKEGQASKEPSFLFLKGELWKLYKNQVIHTI